MSADLLAEMQALRAEVESGATSVTMLLDSLDAAEAELLRKCAITHQFTPDILRVLEPTLSQEAAEESYDEISGLSMVIRTPDGLGLHDRTREELFPSWLEGDRCDEFAAISRRLSDYFAALMSVDAAHQEKYRRRYVFHLIGADQQAGYEAFRKSYDQYRRYLRYTSCVNLVRLVHEYDPILPPDLKRDLRYREGKLLLERDDAESALKMLQPLADDDQTPPLLRIKVMNRIGLALCEMRRGKAAEEVLNDAAKLAETHGAFRDWARVLLNLAEVNLHSGDLDRAERLLKESIELARQAGDRDGIANALNSLGSVHRQAGDHARAIHSYEESLANIAEDDFDRSRVYNNIANCYLDLRDWEKSEKYLLLSLQQKASGGDTAGQATTYENLAKLYVARGDQTSAVAAAQKAVELLSDVSNWYELGRAYRSLARIQGVGPAAQNAVQEAIGAFTRAKAERERKDAEAELLRIGAKPHSRTKTIVWLIVIVVILFVLFRACS